MRTDSELGYPFFLRNAHFFWANKEVILADKRMAGALVPYNMGIPSKHYPLAAYLLYWEKSAFACSVVDSEQCLVLDLGGFPLSGTCFVYRVNEQGKLIRETTDGLLSHMHEFMDIAAVAQELYVDDNVSPYTLADVKKKLLVAD